MYCPLNICWTLLKVGDLNWLYQKMDQGCVVGAPNPYVKQNTQVLSDVSPTFSESIIIVMILV
jgi:hypothetical protein